MTLDDPVKVLAWLQRRPSASELRSAFPAEWDSMEHELEGALQARDPSRLHRLLNAEAPSSGRRVRGTPGRKEKQALVRIAIRQQMARVALQRYAMALATGRTSGKIRFNLFNGWLTPRLLFRRGLERKPVSMTWFRLLWPLVWQKRYLMPLVEPKGIYCFYSKQFVRQLKEIIGGRGCLEVGAGDGTLTRFLQEAGVRATATDDHSWAHRITYPESVIRMDAHAALHEYPSAVVICSWPPAGNDFEREILRSDDVDIYLAIVSVHRAASGNWRDYEQQTRFTLERRPDLARLLVPPELGCDVLLFRRRPAAAA